MTTYSEAGYALVGFGAVVSVVSYFVIQNIPLTALGLGSVMVGLASLLLPPKAVPTSLVKAMLQNSCTNIEAILEQYDARGRAVYLPPRDGYVTAFVPIKEIPSMEVAAAGDIPLRVLSAAGGTKGVTVFPPGSELPKAYEAYQEGSFDDLLRLVLVDGMELASSVRTSRDGDVVVVEIKGPRVTPDLPRFNRCLGSLPTSVAACALSFKEGKRVVVEKEDVSKDKIIAVLREVKVGEE
jgi:hypothetical protein